MILGFRQVNWWGKGANNLSKSWRLTFNRDGEDTNGASSDRVNSLKLEQMLTLRQVRPELWSAQVTRQLLV